MVLCEYCGGVLSTTQIFNVGSTVITSDLIYKYCGDVNDGVCQDSTTYCADAPPGTETPDDSVKPLIRQYIRANLVSWTSTGFSCLEI